MRAAEMQTAGGGRTQKTVDTAGKPRLSLSSVAWYAKDRLSFEEWAEQGRRLGVMGRAAGWWIGDWLIFGNFAYGERYARASRITGYDVQTLMNMAYVASRFDASRRREALSWSHHAELAALAPADQDRWLARAEADRLSVRCLRDAVRSERRARRATDDTALGHVPARALEGAGGDSATHAGHGDGVICPACGHTF